jgi:outer membrane protein assembly factor BamB
MNKFFSKEKSKPENKLDTESIVLGEPDLNPNDILICSTHGKIYAIHKRNGSRLWRSDFPGGSLGGGIVSLFVTDNDKLLVASRGRTACVKLTTGEPLWFNKMPVKKISTKKQKY